MAKNKSNNTTKRVSPCHSEESTDNPFSSAKEISMEGLNDSIEALSSILNDHQNNGVKTLASLLIATILQVVPQKALNKKEARDLFGVGETKFQEMLDSGALKEGREYRRDKGTYFFIPNPVQSFIENSQFETAEATKSAPEASKNERKPTAHRKSTNAIEEYEKQKGSGSYWNKNWRK